MTCLPAALLRSRSPFMLYKSISSHCKVILPLSKCVSPSDTGRTLQRHSYRQHCCGAYHILLHIYSNIHIDTDFVDLKVTISAFINVHVYTRLHKSWSLISSENESLGTLARPSLMVQNGHQNGTERKPSKTQFPRVFVFPFEKEEYSTFQESTNEFRDPENIG